MATFITADLHIDHLKVSELRGFDSPAHHDSVIQKNWNKVVREDDIVYVLGDVAMGTAKEEMFQKLGTRFNGRKILVLGNHDRAHPSNKNGHMHLANNPEYYYAAFDAVVQSATIRHNGEDWLMSHFPYAGTDHTDESRFDQWRLPDLGLPLFHGHTHSSEKLTFSPAGTPQICVGLEAWNLTPVSITEAAFVLLQA